MARVVSVFLPSWPTDRLRRLLGAAAPPAETPLVLVGREGRRRGVLAANRAALMAGLRIGMPVAKAQALMRGLIVRDADPAGDAAGLERLVLWALQRYAPIVAADPPDGIVLDVSGAAHLHGGEEPMIRGMIERIEASGLCGRAALADSWGAAHVLARFSARPALVIAQGESGAAILDLPIEGLRLPRELLESLRALGFETIGELAASPRAPLALRFGPEPGRRLDQAFGRLREPIEPIRPLDLIEVRRPFAEPIAAAETLRRYAGKLVIELCASLEAKGMGARRLDLVFHRVDARIEAIRIGTALPVRDAGRLTRMLCDRIETVDPGFGVEVMSLAASVAEPLAAKQITSSLTQKPEADVSAAIDTLANRVGESRLYRLTAVASDVPERSVRKIAPLAPDTGATWPNHWPRPARLLPAPEPIDAIALLPDYPPVSFTWRGVRRRVRRADGPERVFGEWWKRDAELAAVRDYFRVEDEAGEGFWIFRAGDGEDAATGSQRWFLHGLFG